MVPAARGAGRVLAVSPAAPPPTPTPADEPRRLVIKVTCGVERAEAANQAFTIAATAVAAGVEVSVWLAGEASWFALPGRADDLALAHAAPLAELLDIVLAEGALTLCTQCAVRRDITSDDVIAGVRIAGAPAYVEEILAPGAQALVY